jgi:hypothetical protein
MTLSMVFASLCSQVISLSSANSMFALRAVLLLLLLLSCGVWAQNSTVYTEDDLAKIFIQAGYPSCMVIAFTMRQTSRLSY